MSRAAGEKAVDFAARLRRVEAVLRLHAGEELIAARQRGNLRLGELRPLAGDVLHEDLLGFGDRTRRGDGIHVILLSTS